MPRVQIFATDIDERALAVARAGRYPGGVARQRLAGAAASASSSGDGGSYVVTKEVRDLCIFSPHSVIRDPPFSRIDLVSCRNLLIYFGAEVQSQVIPMFHYALRPGGYLFLGTSENIEPASATCSRRSTRSTASSSAATHGDRRRCRSRWRASAGGAGRPRARPTPAAPGGVGAAPGGRERSVLERFAPAHVVVNRDGDIVYYSARTGKYLEAAAGTPSRQLLAMARKGLRLDLRTALREAMETRRAVTRERRRGRGRRRPRAADHAHGRAAADATAASRCSWCCSPTTARR